ncbi:hypothetical protein PT974_03176 [Cladobotryum mycophilum]|uniref:Uncharacterized protein n=1 Tax=Cladobotryum mycophilum TaxID=491253 RepID=A0ABR0SRN8_9HYPO
MPDIDITHRVTLLVLHTSPKDRTGSGQQVENKSSRKVAFVTALNNTAIQAQQYLRQHNIQDLEDFYYSLTISLRSPSGRAIILSFLSKLASSISFQPGFRYKITDRDQVFRLESPECRAGSAPRVADFVR